MNWEHHNRRPEARAFSGAVLVIIGGLLLFANLNFINIRPIAAQWWPLILVIIGVKHLLFWRGPSALGGGLFWIGTGALFLSSTLGYLNFAITSVIWPLALIWFGIVIVFGCGGRGGRTTLGSGSDM